jgi:hypothetical protein
VCVQAATEKAARLFDPIASAAVPFTHMAVARTQKDQVIDALILVFERSKLAPVVGSEAMRSVLAVEYHDMVSDGVFDMALLWELLEEQPGFEQALALPPLCLFKSWEERLGLTIDLPPAIAELSDKDRALQSSECHVSPSEIRALFDDPVTSREAQKSAAARETQRQPAEKAGGGTAAPQKQRPAWLGWVATAVTVATFAFCSMTLYKHCSDAAWSRVSARIDKQLPVTKVARLGKAMRADVDLRAWNSLTPQIRRDRLRLALLEVEGEGVSAIALVDNGVVVATVQRTRQNEFDVWMRGVK